MNLAAKAPPASPRSWVNSCWMASFQASAATRPRANVINSANLSNTSALNFYSSFPTWASLTSVGMRALCRQTRVYTLNQPGRWRAILPHALLALVLEVDGLLVVVDEHLLDKPAVVVESLHPLRDVFVLHLSGLLTHRRLLLSLIMCFYPREALCISQKGVLEPLFTRRRGREILGGSSPEIAR